MSSKRIESVDVAKGIAIICMVIGHIHFFNTAGADVTERWIYQFHMPLFFVIAGYFLSTKHPIDEFVKGKALRLLVPYLVINLMLLVVNAVVWTWHDGNAWPLLLAQPKDVLLALLYGTGSWIVPTPADIAPIGATWFLLAMFIAIVFCRVCLRFKHGLLLTIPFAVICFLTARIFWMPFSLQSAGVASLFIAAGYWLKQHDFLRKPISPLLVLISVGIYVIAGIYNLEISLASLFTRGNVLFALVIALSGSLLFLNVSRLIDEHAKPVAHFLTFFGKSSMVVLCVHSLLLNLGLRTLLASFTGLDGNLLSCIDLPLQLAICAGCVVAFKRIPGIRRIFY